MKATTITLKIELTATTHEELLEVISHMRGERTIEQAAGEMLRSAIANSAYRYERNKTQWIAAKSNKQLLAQLLREKEEREKREETE